MVVTMEEVIRELRSDEPDYERAAKLGLEALPHLEILVKIAMPLIAARAAYMAAHLQNEKSVDILMLAAHRDFVQIRLAAAEAIRYLPFPSVEKALDLLKNDVEVRVRKMALRSMDIRNKGPL